MLKLMASFSVNCPFLFPNFAFSYWKKLGSQAATSSSMGTLLASYAEITQVIRFENKHLFPQKFTKQLAVILRNTREFNDILKI